MLHISDALALLCWNVYIGNSWQDVRAEIKDFIDRFKPEVFILMEASKLYGHLDGLGYKVIQMKPRALRPGNQPGQGNIAILVRNDIKIKRRLALFMQTFWIGPKHGWPQDPRVYRWVKIVWRNRTWKIGGAHTPFGAAARAESRRKLVRWVRNTSEGRPTLLGLDANMSLTEFRETIAQPSGSEADGSGIDLVLYKNAVLHSKQNLGNHGSDHPAMLYKFFADPS